jgi:hypothetical protein
MKYKMGKYFSYGIHLFALIGFSHYVEGRRPMHKNSDKISESHAIGTQENAKEIRHFSKVFRKQQRYDKKVEVNKQLQKYTKFSQKKFNMHTLNRPFARHLRSSKIGIVPLYKLPNENK